MEILIVISAAAIIVAVGAQAVFVSLQSSKISGERGVAMDLLRETHEAVKSAATEKWQNVFSLSKGAANYYPQNSSGRWLLTAGSEDVIINSITYTRYFAVQNMCRDASTRDVTGITDTNGTAATCADSGGTYDPSTQKINVLVSWSGADTVSSSEYITRWMNKVCSQTSWSSIGSGVENCPAATYESSTNITAGDNLQLCSGC